MSKVVGLWSADDLRRAFVAGAKWWEYKKENATMWGSDIILAEEEAENRYPNGKCIDELIKVTLPPPVS